jgi:hypothetical protein
MLGHSILGELALVVHMITEQLVLPLDEGLPYFFLG